MFTARNGTCALRPSTAGMAKVPTVSTKMKKKADSTAGRTTGSVTRTAVRSTPAPFRYDASSNDGSMLRSEDDTVR